MCADLLQAIGLNEIPGYYFGGRDLYSLYGPASFLLG